MSIASQTTSSRLRTLWVILAIALLSSAVSACGSAVGDDCETQTDCGQTMFCELSMEAGYCTRRSCELDGCPDQGVCITFEVGTSYCMRQCASADDCREGYTCVEDFGLRPFCNDSRGVSPGSAMASAMPEATTMTELPQHCSEEFATQN